MTEEERFDALLDAMVHKPPRDIADTESPAGSDDLREDDD